MPPKFGTSGVRGLVTELTDAVVADFVRAFLGVCDTGPALYVGRDLRDSSPGIAAMVMDVARDMGRAVVDCGAVATPALALAAMAQGCGAVMVTGSHIPADRNGIKFYTLEGEITKEDEAAILGALGRPALGLDAELSHDSDAAERFHDRYVSAFGQDALRGARIGVYTHSAVGRDMLMRVLQSLGAEVVELGRSETFIPVDTEAVDAQTRAQLADWARSTDVHSIVSSDGDSDRPLLTDATGTVVPGDVLGQITARLLGAEVVVTPVSSNTGVERGGHFAEVVRTRIGSPFVLAGMAGTGAARVVGYEANGGFILGFAAQGPAGALPPLATRDFMLPIIATLVASRVGEQLDVAGRVAQEPARFTASDRLENIAIDTSARCLAELIAQPARRADLLAGVGMAAEQGIDLTDGLRLSDTNGTVLHLRPSGNAPEFRIYAEADSAATAQTLLAAAQVRLRAMLG
jgi:phosphomannomutase